MPKRRSKVRRGATQQGRRPEQHFPVPFGGPRTTYRFRRTYIAATVTQSVGTAALGAVNVGPAVWPSSLISFVQNFDLCRIDRATVTLVPHYNVSSAGGTAGELPLVVVVRNYDDNSTPASFAAVQQQAGAYTTRFSRPIKCVFVPAVILAVAGTTTLTAGVMPGLWWNTAAGGMNALGMKYAVQAVAGLPGNGVFDVLVSLDFTCSQALM